MFRGIRKDARTIVIAVVAASLIAGAPAIADGVKHALFAHNADKVDGKHAVASGAKVKSRKGKLVATSGTTGRLPNNIIAKAPDADKLDGIDSSVLRGRFKSTTFGSSTPTELTCTELGAVTINVPATGTVVVDARVQVGVRHTNNYDSVWVWIEDGTASGCAPGSGWAYVNVPINLPSADYRDQLAPQRVFTNVAAGSHTYRLVGYTRLDSDEYIDHGSLTAQYIPG